MASSDDTKHRPGQLPVHFWVEEAKKQEWQKFAAMRGQSLREVIVEAMARHIAYPSAVPVPIVPPPAPLPDGAPKRGRGRPRKNVQNNS